MKIEFIYDEESKKWDVHAIGAADAPEAVQAFNAVLITMRQALVTHHHKAEPLSESGSFSIIPAVRG